MQKFHFDLTSSALLAAFAAAGFPPDETLIRRGFGSPAPSFRPTEYITKAEANRRWNAADERAKTKRKRTEAKKARRRTQRAR